MNPILTREAGLDPDRNRPFQHRMYPKNPVAQPTPTVGGTMSGITQLPIAPVQDFSDYFKAVPEVAVKHDEEKTDWSLVPFEALEGMADVLTFGAKKYDSWNWTSGGGFHYLRVARSCLRHIFAFMRGEDNDPESGLSHINHAQCNLLFLAFYLRNRDKYNKDDRYVR